MLVDVDVWAGDLYAGTLPQICVFTGSATPSVHRVRYSAVPRWVIALLFAGILPYVIGVRLTRRTVVGALPMSAPPLRRFAAHRLVSGVIVVAVPVICFAAAVLLGNGGRGDLAGIAALAGFACLLVGAVVSTIWFGAISIQGRIDDRPGWGRWVRLRGVDPTFAAAIHHLYATRAPEWQIGTVPAGFRGVALPDGYAPAPGPPGWSPPGQGGAVGWPQVSAPPS